MNNRSLVVLSICLVIGAGIAAGVWAYVCCDEVCLCNGGRVQVPDSCLFRFQVDHDRECGTGHDVYLYLRAQGEPAFTEFLMNAPPPPPPPYDACMEYYTTKMLEPGTVYYYYFGCADCDEECCHDHFNTGDCDS